MLEDYKQIEKILYLNKNMHNFDLIFDNIFQKLDYELIEKIYNIIKKDTDKFLKKKINIISSYIKNTQTHIESEKIIQMYISLYIYKNMVFSKIKKDAFFNYHFINSDELINNISSDLFTFLMSFEIKYGNILIYNYNLIRSIINSILINLTNNNIISNNKIFINNKTKAYFFLKNTNNAVFYSPKLYYSPFIKYITNSNKIYIYSDHYSSITSIFKQNNYSNAIFGISKNSKLIDKLCQTWAYLDKNKLLYVYNETLADNNLISEELEVEYNIINVELSNAINNKNMYYTSELSKKLSIYENVIKIKKILNLNLNEIKLYFPFKFDFRGRLYYLSDISITFYNEFRYCLHKGKYENLNIKEETYGIESLNNELDSYIYMLNELNNYDFKNKKIQIKRSILWILISIAEPFKSEIGEKISTKEFLEKGIYVVKNYKNIEKNINLEKKIKIKYLIDILNEINNDVYIKWFVSKDATASCFQHLIKILGGKNNLSLQLCNMQSNNCWYDTYAYIINNFKKECVLENITQEEFNFIFNRNNLKKTLMTENYGAKEKSCLNYFINNFDINKYNDLKKTEIIKIFKIFYNYIHISNHILKESSESIIFFFKKNNFKEMVIILNDESTIDYKYYKHKIKQFEWTYNNKRYTKQEKILTNKIYDQKALRAVKANYIQSMDASLIRWYLESNEGMTIHDCFMIDYLNISELVLKINIGMRIVYHKINKNTNIATEHIYSPYIIL